MTTTQADTQVDPQVDTLAARRTYIERNNAYKRKFWWRFQRDSGLFSAVDQLLSVMLACLRYNRRLCLHTYADTRVARRLYSFTGYSILSPKLWSDYFEPFCEERPCVITSEMVMSYALDIIRNKCAAPLLYPLTQWPSPTTAYDMAIMRKNHVRMPRFDIDGDLWAAKQKLLQMIYVLNERTQAWVDKRNKALQLPPSYVGVHIRRGDKVLREATPVPIDDYIRKVQEITPDAQCVFIGTDDYTTVEKFRRHCPQNWQVITSCPAEKKGYSQKAMMRGGGARTGRSRRTSQRLGGYFCHGIGTAFYRMLFQQCLTSSRSIEK